MEIDFYGNPFDQENTLIKSDKKSSYDRAKVNKVNTVEDKSYSLINNSANPFKLKDRVVLKIENHERYSHIQNLKEGDIPRVSAVLGEGMVNIGFSYTIPMTVKNVPTSDLVLFKEESFLAKVRVFIKSFRIVKKFLVYLAQEKLRRSAKNRLKKMRKK